MKERKRRHKIYIRDETFGDKEMMEFYKVSSVRYANHVFPPPHGESSKASTSNPCNGELGLLGDAMRE